MFKPLRTSGSSFRYRMLASLTITALLFEAKILVHPESLHPHRPVPVEVRRRTPQYSFHCVERSFKVCCKWIKID